MKISKTKKNWKNSDQIQKSSKAARVPGKRQRTKSHIKEMLPHGIQTFWQ